MTFGLDHHNPGPAVCSLVKTFYNHLSLCPDLGGWGFFFFFSGRLEWAGGGEIKRSEASFHWQTVSVKNRGLMIGAARNIIYPEWEDVWLESSSPSSSGGTSSLYKCTIKMRCSHSTLSPSDAWPMRTAAPYRRVTSYNNNNTDDW